MTGEGRRILTRSLPKLKPHGYKPWGRSVWNCDPWASSHVSVCSWAGSHVCVSFPCLFVSLFPRSHAQVNVTSSSQETLATFYTSLYHVFCPPTQFSEVSY